MALSTVLCLIALIVSAVLSEDTFSEKDIKSDWSDVFDEWEGRIIGGRNAAPGQFPHQVALRLRNGFLFCGGSIIAPQFILSAANCFQRQTVNPNNVRVAVGAHRRTNDGTIHTVSGILKHRQYSLQLYANDIAIVRTTNPIIFNSLYVRIISLANRATPDNLPLALSGWGAIEFNPRPGATQRFPEVLQYKLTVSLNRQQCQRRLGSRHGTFVHENTVCTANVRGRGACIGDTGGPLIGQDGAQYGVLSWGIQCAHGVPDVYTSVFHHLQWIQAAIR